MATRPAWTIREGAIVSRDFDFFWNGGFALSQKQKNIRNLHQAIEQATGGNALEVSSKSHIELGRRLSAFSLKLNNVYLENIFQSSKKYENGGPYIDLLGVEPKDAKRDERHRTSGKLLAFVKDGIEWPLEPKTAFYDYLYIMAVIENFGYDLDLSAYSWFTDNIEFNPQKSINCQARSTAIYKLLQEKKMFDAINDKYSWKEFHRKYIT